MPVPTTVGHRPLTHDLGQRQVRVSFAHGTYPVPAAASASPLAPGLRRGSVPCDSPAGQHPRAVLPQRLSSPSSLTDLAAALLYSLYYDAMFLQSDVFHPVFPATLDKVIEFVRLATDYHAQLPVSTARSLLDLITVSSPNSVAVCQDYYAPGIVGFLLPSTEF